MQRTVPFGMICRSLTILWYATHGHSPADTAERRARSRWYTTTTEPSFEDMAIKLRRVIIAERFRPQAPYQATPEETHAFIAAWAAAPGRPPSRYEASVASARAPGSILTAGGARVSPGHA
ncbi:hypothetical protein [Nonomuraea sp. NPDC049141]|uniref:hypothetical protein n=1 Tax=unclassified Nonomuraea TaxID=2593643 RepID=UPI00340B05F5